MEDGVDFGVVLTVVVIATGACVGLLYFLASWGVQSAAFILAYMAAVALHASVVTLLLILLKWTLAPMLRVALAGLAVGAATAVVKLDMFVKHAELHGYFPILYISFSVVAAIVAVVVTLVVFESSSAEASKFFFYILAGLTTVALSVAALVGSTAVVSWWRQFRLAEKKADPIVPITNIPPGTYLAIGDSYSAGEGLKALFPV